MEFESNATSRIVATNGFAVILPIGYDRELLNAAAPDEATR